MYGFIHALIAIVGKIPLWIVLLPLLGALVNGVAGRHASKKAVTAMAVGSVVGSFVLALIAFSLLLAIDVAGGQEGFAEYLVELARQENERLAAAGLPQTAYAPEFPRERIVQSVYEWFSISVRGVDVPIHVRFVMDHLSGLMTVMVTGVGSLIHVYSIGYMEEDEGYSRFMTYLNLFMASMLVLVLASNLPLMFVGWEGVGLCSYLLIGFWYTNADYAAAGRKAFVVNRIGDFGVLIGMFLLVSAVADPRTPDAFEFATINDVATRLGLTEVTFGASAIGVSVATAATLFFFLGCAGKSAQIPLYVWLPDAMAGPTPVSALIHAATMVTAGVYLLCRLSPVVVESPFGMSVIAIVGALTALLAASIALVQNQMKKILAYSTVSQLGFMFAAVGTGAFAGGFFHVFTHAFFKACLFLGAGSVMHAVHAHGDADIRYLGGLRKKMPATHVTFAIATAAIAGVPLLSGFFSKDEILLGAATWATAMPVAPWVGWLVLGMLVLAATMTAFYMFRLYFRAFWGTFKGGHPPDEHHGDEEEEGHGHQVEPHESPRSMTVPLWILAGGAAIAGFLGLPHALGAPNWWSNWMSPQHEVFLETMHEAEHAGMGHEDAVREGTRAAQAIVGNVASLQFEGQLVHAPPWAAFLAMGLGILAVLLGGLLAYSWYAKEGNPAPEKLKNSMPGFHRLLMDKWRVDEAYDWLIVSPMKWLAVFAANIDRFFVDGILARASAFLMQGAGWLLTRTQNGLVYAYAGLFVLGFAVLGWWFTYPHADLEAEPGAGTIEWTASRGLGYEYRWDFDSDGEWEVEEWTDGASATHDYEGAAYYGLVAVFGGARELLGEAEVVVEQGEVEVLPLALLGPDWRRPDAEGAVPPTMAYEDGRLRVRINDAAIPDTDGEDDGVVTLDPGDTLQVGTARMTVAVRVRGTVEIRNVFGNLSRETEDVTLRVPRRIARAEEVQR